MQLTSGWVKGITRLDSQLVCLAEPVTPNRVLAKSGPTQNRSPGLKLAAKNCPGPQLAAEFSPD